jgi:Spy/CpxP family protein refolding chaperone
MMFCPAMAAMPPQAGMIDRMAETLQLTHDQSAKLKKVSAKSDQTLRPLTQKSAEASKALRAALLASDYNTKKVKDLAAKAEKAEAEVVTASIGTWTQIRAILTKSQIAKMQKTMNIPVQGPSGPPTRAGSPPPPPGR